MPEGLSSQQAKESLRAYGPNKIETKEGFKVFSLLLSQLPSFINSILLLAAIFSFAIGDVLESFFILTILLLTIVFGFFQEYKAEKALEKLKEYITPLSNVIRDGKESLIPTEEIVPGDIVVISEGDFIPADGRVINNHYLEADESMLTGESIPVIKNVKDKLYSGSLVVKGRAKILIEETGMHTKFGKIAEGLSEIKEEKTPLQKRLSFLGKAISILTIIVAFSLIPIGLLTGKDFPDLLLTAVSVSVAGIPEGLPAVITIALALGTIRMAKQNAVVRKIPAVETLGSVQVILTDKTGTLTENRMRVKESWINNKAKIDHLYKACILGNSASLIEKGDGEFDAIGDKTDGALLVWAKKEKVDLENLKNEGEVKDEFVFDPKSKMITTVWKKGENFFVYVRGAPEVVLEKSKGSEKEKQEIRKTFEEEAKKGLRIIAFGVKQVGTYQKAERVYLEKELEFLGFVAIADPLRKEIKESVEKARRAGIKTIMVTGDNELTALTIAKEAGIVQKNEDVITGEELSKISDEELGKIIFEISVFARTKPEDKLRLVNIIKKSGLIVGVTGDGVNDALALKQADVGVAMGKKGTDVAKEASDIVLTDDNYSTLVSAVLEGRTVYNNIVKAITYLLSGNLSEISLVFFGTLLGLPAPLLPTQILWVNLVTDGLPALALASDNKNNGVLNEHPRDPKEPIVTKERLIFILLIGFSVSSLLLLTFVFMLNFYNSAFARTIIFNILILFHMVFVFAIRGKMALRFNKFLVLSVALSLFLQLLINTVPFLREIFHLNYSL